MGMVLPEVLKLTFDRRHAAGCGEDFPVAFRFPQTAAIACHGRRFRTEVLGCQAIDALGFQRVAVHAFRESGFSQCAIATQLPHLANSLDFDGAKFAIIKTTNFRF